MTYEAHRLPQLWTMVEADDGSAAAYHLNTWERQITLLSEQSKRLKDLRADLVSRWPPEQSDASFAFVSRVTEMINAMDQTVDDSVRVRTGLKQVADALEGARKQLAPLLAEYHDKASAWHSVTHGVFPELPVSLISGVGVIPGADEYVLQAHQRKLDEQAREIMRRADQIVTEAQEPLSTQMVSYGRYGTAGEEYHGLSSGGNRALNIGGRGSRFLGPSEVRQFVPPPRFDPPLPAPIDLGPVLAATDPPANVGPGKAGVRPIPLVPEDAGRFAAGQIPASNPPTEAMRQLPPDRSVLRPGGVIDGRNPAFEPRPGTSPAGFPGIIGGMAGRSPLGGSRSGVNSSERPGRSVSLPGRVIEGGSSTTTGMTGGWRDRQYEEYVKRRQVPTAADPDNPWAVAEGIAPVIEPPPERRHDVGPGVIGIDR
jgi:hypothetical protein